MKWVLRHGAIDFSAVPVVMGALNVTPDSFSDGGRLADAEAACGRADEMVAQGAGIIDVGPESTRPGSEPVPASQQIDRVAPVIRGIRRAHPDVPISIDTRLAAVAGEAIELGADIINDVSALRDDDDMVGLARDTQTPVILMHMRGRPKTMQSGPTNLVYADVVREIMNFLTERVAYAVEAGIPRQQIAVDPGIGFGKTVEHNLIIIQRIDELTALGLPVVLGASRKRFIGTLLDQPEPRDRLSGSLACAVAGVLGGAHVLRVHDVAQTVEAVRIAQAIRTVS